MPGDPDVHTPDSHHPPNGFSKIAFKGLVLGAAGTKPLADVGVKTATELLELLGKTYPLYMLS